MSFTLTGTKCGLCGGTMDPETEGVYVALALFTKEAREGRGPEGRPYGGPLEEVPDDKLRVVFRSAGTPKVPVHFACWRMAVEAFPLEATEDKDIWYMQGPFRIRNASGLYLNAISYWRDQFKSPGKLFGDVKMAMTALTTIGNDLYYRQYHQFPVNRTYVSKMIPPDWVIEDLGTRYFAQAQRFHVAQCRRPK